MHDKSIQTIQRSKRHSTGWMRAMRGASGEREMTRHKDVRRLSSIFDWLDDRDRGRGNLYKNYRSWKAHCKCRHQWEKHEFPVINFYCGSMYELALDHNRKWILERLRQKRTCIFNLHHDDWLEDILETLVYEGVCTNLKRVGNGLVEISLNEQEAGIPHEKTSIGEKAKSGRHDRRHRQRERQKRRAAGVEAVAERTRRVRRKDADGIVKAPLPDVAFVAKPQPVAIVTKYKRTTEEMLTPFDILYKDAKGAHLKGVNRNSRPCLNLIQNYSHYCKTSKTALGLAPYEHDYHNFTNAIEQCCVWLTGRRPKDFPPWVISMLTDSVLEPPTAKRLLGWTFGNYSVRECYGLSRNEASEIVKLPANINSEAKAIVAAISLARHSSRKLTGDLVKFVPTFCNFFECLESGRKRNFIRSLVEWLNTLATKPDSAKLHDMLDFFFHSGISNNPLFSFKGRTLPRVEELMHQWHMQQQLLKNREQRAAMSQSWCRLGYDYTHDNDFVFRELTNGQALLDEGNAQHNCVFSYRNACMSGKTSIVSMRRICSSEHLTIEINNASHSIVQIREVCNKLPTRDEMRIVRIFASVKNLSIS